MAWRLKKLGACLHLDFKLGEHRTERIGFRRHSSADRKRRRTIQLIAGHIVPVVEPLHELHDLNGIQVVDRLGLFMISDGWIVPGEAENIADAEHGRAHEIRLYPDPIPIAAGHLHDRIMAEFVEKSADRQRPGSNHSSRIVA